MAVSGSRLAVRLLTIFLLCIPSVSFSVTDEGDPCGLKSPWSPFFKPAISKRDLFNQLGNKNSLEKRRGPLLAMAVRVGDRTEAYLLSRYSSIEQAKSARNLHWALKEFVPSGILGPFRILTFHARAGETIFSEFIEGRTVEDLKTDKSLEHARVQEVSDRFKEGLSAAKKFANDSGMQVAEKDNGITISFGTGDHLSILSSNVVVEASTGDFVLVRFD